MGTRAAEYRHVDRALSVEFDYFLAVYLTDADSCMRIVRNFALCKSRSTGSLISAYVNARPDKRPCLWPVEHSEPCYPINVHCSQSVLASGLPHMCQKQWEYPTLMPIHYTTVIGLR